MNSWIHTPDLFVVGGGPAGLALAILAAQRGLRVTLADRRTPPIDKVCGEGLMPDTIAALRVLGIGIGPHESVMFRGVRFRGAEESVAIAAEFRRGFGLGVRRTVLHQKLVDRAAALGVTLLWGSRVVFENEGNVLCDGRPVHSHWTIGADGEASLFRKWAGLEQIRYEQVRYAARRHFRTHPWSDFVEVYWSRDCQIVVAPLAADELCVAVTSRNPRLRFSYAIDQVPALATRLAHVPTLDKPAGTRSALRRLRRVHRGRLALLGDASGSVDPLTGEGIGLALRQAAALLAAIERNDLRIYQEAHNRMCRAPRLMSRLMLLMDAHSRLRGCVLRALAAVPSVFSCLLNINVGSFPASDFNVAQVIRGMLYSGSEL